MPSLNIVLVEPEIPQNTGNIARTCAVTGAALHLVGPMGFRLEDKRLRHAGLDYWPYLTLATYPSLSDFFEKNQGDFFFFSTKAQHRHTDVSYPDGCYLLFGKESAGLPEKLLFDHPDQCVRIPMLGGFRSLNLQTLRQSAPMRFYASGISRAFLLGRAAVLRLGRGQGSSPRVGIL